jgi:hypothetical protein
LRKSLLIQALAGLIAGCSPQPASRPAEMHAYELSLTVAQGQAFAAWHGGFGQASAIYMQRLEAGDRLGGPAFKISDGTQLAYEPDLIFAAGRLVAAWYEKDHAGHLTGRLSALTPDGKRLWLVAFGNPREQVRNPVVRERNDHLEVAWIEQPLGDDHTNRASVWYQRFSSDGQALSPARRIGQANRDTWNLNACVSGDNLIVVYDAAIGSKAHELRMVVVGENGAHQSALSPDDGFASVYPDIQVNGAGQAALTWFDTKDGNEEVYLLAEPLDALESGRMSSSFRVSYTQEDSTGAYVAWNGSTIGLAWSDVVSGRRDILVRTFTADGKPFGPVRAFRPVKGEASIPAIRASGSGFLVAWNDYLAQGAAGHAKHASSIARIASLPITR